MTIEDRMQLKAWSKLAFLREKWMRNIMYRTRNYLEYKDKLPNEELENRNKLLECINNPDKWAYYGILSAEEKAQLELLEYLINDHQEEIQKYRYIPFQE